jgi:hypothetical protein
MFKVLSADPCGPPTNFKPELALWHCCSVLFGTSVGSDYHGLRRGSNPADTHWLCLRALSSFQRTDVVSRPEAAFATPLGGTF